MLAGCTISNFYHISGWQKAWLKKITAPSVTHSMGSGSFFVGAGAARAIARLHLPYLCRPPGLKIPLRKHTAKVQQFIHLPSDCVIS